MNLLFLDFETYYAVDYTLSSKTTTTQDYILDRRFKVHGVGLIYNNSPAVWVSGNNVHAILEKFVTNSTVVCHNAAFDCSILTWQYNLYPKQIIDTVSLSRAMIGSKLAKHSLGNVAQLLLGKEKTKGLDVAKNKSNLTQEEEKILAEYCKNDVTLCRDIYYKLIEHFPKEELYVMDWCARIFTQPKLELDASLLTSYRDELIERKKQVLIDLGLEDRTILMSNPKFAEALETLGVIPPTKLSLKTGKETFAFAKTDEGLKELAEHENPDVQALVAARLEHKSTIEETRAQSYIKAAQFGPWPVHYNYSGATQTHRFSGGKGAGGNPQNLKRGGTLRKAITAPTGKNLIVGDLAQIECRITLALANEQEGLEKLSRGEDLYSWFASRMYGKEINKKDYPLERQVGKSAVLGLGYGMGAAKFQNYCQQQDVSITEELATDAVNIYRRTFPGVPKLWKTAELALSYAYENKSQYNWGLGLLKTTQEPLFNSPAMQLPNGLCIKYPGLNYEFLGRQWSYNGEGKTYKIWGGLVVENCVQALARCIMVEQLVKLDKYMPIVMTTHDELIAVVPEEKAQVAEKIMSKVMSTPPAWWPELPLAAEIHSGVRYGDIK